ncbi:MAG: cobalamin biosynthesis protein [Alphaproteobacteria bacterium]
MVRAIARFADRRLNRPMRSARSRRVRGALVLLFLLPVAAPAGYAGASVCRMLPDGWAVEACLVAMCVGLQRPLVAGTTIRGALVRAGLQRARKVLAGASGAKTDAADVHGLARGSVKLFAVRLCDGLAGPVFWYAVVGLPCLFVDRAVVAAADALAHPTLRYAAFGTAAAALERLLNLVPPPLTGLLIFLSALFAPTTHPAAALRGMLAGAGLSAAGWIGDRRARDADGYRPRDMALSHHGVHRIDSGGIAGVASPPRLRSRRWGGRFYSPISSSLPRRRAVRNASRNAPIPSIR